MIQDSMTMNKTSILLIGFLLLISACRQADKQNNNQRIQIIDLDKLEQKNPIPEFMDKIKLIPLETNDSCLIGNIKKIEISQPYIFIIDHNNNFFTYNTNGSFLFKVTASGKGLEEISSINNFYLNNLEKYIGIYDHLKNKVFRYNFQGELIKIVDCKTNLLLNIQEINTLPDGKLLLALDYSPMRKHGFTTLNNENYSLDKSYKSYSYTWKKPSRDGIRPKQTQNGEGTYIISMLSDTLYQYKNGDFVPIWVLKSKLKPASHQYINPDLVSDYRDVIQRIQKQENVSRGFQNIHLTDSTGYTSYYYNEQPNKIFWNLKSGKGFITKDFGRYPNALMNFKISTTTAEHFVGYISACDIDLEIIAKECTPEITKTLTNVREDDNPVVIFYPILVE